MREVAPQMRHLAGCGVSPAKESVMPQSFISWPKQPELNKDAAARHRHRPGRRDNRLVFIAKNHTPDLRLEIGFVLDELLLQMFSRKLERHELVMIMRAARGWKRFVPDRVIA